MPSRLQPASVRKHRAVCRTGSDHDVLCRTAQRLGGATRGSQTTGQRQRCTALFGTSVIPSGPFVLALIASRKTASRGFLTCAVMLAFALVATTAFGLAGIRLDASPAASFVCVMTGSVVCLATAGVVALVESLKSGNTGLTTANYWHFVNAAWVFLLGFVYIWR